MITEDQSEVVTFLASPSTHGGAVVDRIETHASIVFLAGARAWKLKRAVRTTIWTSRRSSDARRCARPRCGSIAGPHRPSIAAWWP